MPFFQHFLKNKINLYYVMISFSKYISVLIMLLITGMSPITHAQIKVGTGKTDITPPLGVPLEGYYVDRFATHIHDPLYARAMVIDDGNTYLVLVIVDVIDVAPTAFPAARTRIQKEFNIPESNIVISATHTHTGPVIKEAYEKLLETKIHDAVKLAFNTRQPAVIRSGIGHEDGISFHRRFLMKDGTVKFNPGVMNPDIVRPMGPIDPDVGILFIESMDGIPIALLLNFALHLDTIGGTEISADFPYFMGKLLKKLFGEDLMVFFGFGTCGNVNHINVNNPERLKGYERAERVGHALAASVIREFPALEKNEITELKSGNQVVMLKTPEYTEEEYDMARINARKESDLEASTPEIREAMKILRIENRKGEPIEAEILTFGMDKVGIVALPGEIFVELGLEIKKRSPYEHTFIITLSNNSIGYIPNEEAFEYGAYEVEVSEIAKGEGEKMVDTSIELLKKMKK
jgi:neutral ceramidase